MTNQEAIDIVEDIGFYVPLLDSQEEALNQLIKTAKDWDKMVETSYVTLDKFYTGKELREVVKNIKSYVVNTEGLYKALEKQNEN